MVADLPLLEQLYGRHDRGSCYGIYRIGLSKNIRHYDLNKAYALMRKNAFEVAGDQDYRNGMGRRALPSYLKYGYIPMEDSVPIAFHKKEQVSRTLEYAFDDYALGLVAKGLHHDEDANLLQKRALNYQNIFDPSVGMMRGRHADGHWAQSFHADLRESYITEGTPRQYSFYVPQDIPGLIKLMGGKKSFELALDSLFQKMNTGMVMSQDTRFPFCTIIPMLPGRRRAWCKAF